MNNFKQLIGLPENAVIEYKSAKGGLPASLWETYSSFANSNGDIIVLGIKEKNGHLTPDNLTEDQLTAYKKNFWDSVHNHAKVSATLVTENDVAIENWQGSSILVINVPRARFDQRPVFLNHNPLGNTYIRNNEGGMLVSVEEYYAGSRSKCRNPLLQTMFRLVGYGEKAGSGADIIAQGWAENHWARPTISETLIPGETELILTLQKQKEQISRQNGRKNGVEHGTVKLTDRQHIIMGLIHQFVVEHVVEDGVEKLSARVIAQKVKSSPRTIQRELSYLQEKGLIKYTGTDTKGYYDIVERLSRS